MRRSLYAVLSAVVVFAPTALLAQDVLPQPLSQIDGVKVTGVGNAVVANWAGVYVGPYDGLVYFTSGTPASAPVSLYCVDYMHDISVGDHWQVNATDLGATSPDLSETLLGTGSFAKYQQAAYLASLFDSWTSYGPTKIAVYSAIHAAIWSIMGASLNATAQAEAAPFESMAVPSDFSLAGWAVLTDVGSTDNGKTGQEYLIHTTVTPEPQTYILLLSGLIVVFGVRWWRRRESSAFA